MRKPATSEAIRNSVRIAKAGMRYCGNGLPGKPLPAGRFLVHNHVAPACKLGTRGFRAWTQQGRSGLVRCRCDFGGCKNAELHEHYRVRSLAPLAFRKTAAVKAGGE